MGKDRLRSLGWAAGRDRVGAQPRTCTDAAAPYGPVVAQYLPPMRYRCDTYIDHDAVPDDADLRSLDVPPTSRRKLGDAT
jgi:hypothetical protein